MTRAPVAPKAEELDAKAVRNGILHGRFANYGPKWSAWLVRDVGFPYAKLMISCFHRKLHKQVLVSDHWHQKVASWAPECKKYCVLYYFFGCTRMILGPGKHGPGQSPLDRTSAFLMQTGVLCALATDWGVKLG